MSVSKQDWLELGLEALAQGGAKALTIDALQQKLGVTKGSFYHHFQNREDFSEALLGFWEQRLTLDLITASEREGAPLDKMLSLYRMVEQRANNRLEVAIRAWALQDGLAERYQRRVDAQRLEYCRMLAAGLLDSEQDGWLLGTLIFTAFLGGQQMLPALNLEEERMLQKFILGRVAGIGGPSKPAGGHSFEKGEKKP